MLPYAFCALITITSRLTCFFSLILLQLGMKFEGQNRSKPSEAEADEVLRINAKAERNILRTPYISTTVINT